METTFEKRTITLKCEPAAANTQNQERDQIGSNAIKSDFQRIMWNAGSTTKANIPIKVPINDIVKVIIN